MKARWTISTSIVLLTVMLSMLVVSPTQATGPLSGVKVCLDPGHGGDDPGAVNTTYNLEESDINLDVSYALKGLLEGDDAQVRSAVGADQRKRLEQAGQRHRPEIAGWRASALRRGGRR